MINFEIVFFRTVFFLSLLAFIIISFCIFFDQAVLVRKGTVFRVPAKKKKVALTFDDGPSPTWTPRILDALKDAGIKATFFLIGSHVKQYPEIARRIVAEGHTIGNHGYAHSVLLYYTDEELEEEIKYTELVIKEVTGQTTKYFRPPKAWVGSSDKKLIRGMGYDLILWSINSKDWVPFNHKHIARYITRCAGDGDIFLFHDSGGVIKAEGGDRQQTLQTIPLIAQNLKNKGFEFVTIEELLK